MPSTAWQLRCRPARRAPHDHRRTPSPRSVSWRGKVIRTPPRQDLSLSGTRGKGTQNRQYYYLSHGSSNYTTLVAYSLKAHLNHRNKITTSERSRVRIFLPSIGLLALLISTLVLIPFTPPMPGPGLDLSWSYGLNQAVSLGYVFGRDLIFTFGPLGSIYTGAFDPKIDHITLIGSTLIAFGFASAFGVLAYPKRLIFCLVLPFIVIFCPRDAVFITLPFLLLLIISRTCLRESSKLHLPLTPPVVAGITVAVIACSLTPIIKGSFSISTFSLCGLAFIALFLRSKSAALGFAMLFISSMAFAWKLSGQALYSLPYFFIAQLPIISGYTNAMSVEGATMTPIVYITAASLVFLVLILNFPTENRFLRSLVSMGLLLDLFVLFKSGFVRQDGHVLICSSALLILGLAISLISAVESIIVVGVVTVVGWFLISDTVSPVTVRFISNQIAAYWDYTSSGMKTRIFNSTLLNKDYRKNNDIIRAMEPLPFVSGTVDIYPTELSAIFANGLRWTGRPVFQSYSVFTPNLDAANVAHLYGPRAPQTVFFTFSPIDNRLPTADDSGSILPLLANYRITNYYPPYVRMDRHPGAMVAQLENAQTRSFRASWGDQIILDSETSTWVSLDVRETLLGRVVEALFKLPRLEIELTLADGRKITHRYIASIGRTGFILSPYLSSAEDLITFAAGVPVAPEVKSFRLVTRNSRFWKHQFLVRTTPIRIEPETSARSVYFSPPLHPPIALAAPSQSRKAQCNLDVINGHPFQPDQVLHIADPSLRIQGWVDLGHSIKSQEVETWVLLSSEEGTGHYFRARVLDRPDVVGALGRPELSHSGFGVAMDLAGGPRRQKANIFLVFRGASYECPESITLDSATSN
jgi:hypothetical protein